MTLLFTQADCTNELGINIGNKLGEGDNNTVFIANWLMERQNEIIQYIASYSIDGTYGLDVDNMTEYAQGVLKNAIKYQVEYVLANARQNTLGGLIMASNGTVHRVNKYDRIDAIVAPKAHQLLMNEKFLYTGRHSPWQ